MEAFRRCTTIVKHRTKAIETRVEMHDIQLTEDTDSELITSLILFHFYAFQKLKGLCPLCDFENFTGLLDADVLQPHPIFDTNPRIPFKNVLQT
jgi:hypothetical protein